MNRKVFDTNIRWLSVEEGGRSLEIPFKATKYATQIAIDGNRIICGSSWSVFCYSYEIIESLKTKSYIRFLNVEQAPDILFVGTKFQLFEGPKKVAVGEIVNIVEDVNPIEL